MNLPDIILIAIALAMDCFVVSIVSGIMVSTRWHCNATLSKREYRALRMAFLFGIFQALMPLIGWLAVSRFQSYLTTFGHWIAFLLLVFIGGKMIVESFQKEKEEHFDPRRLTTQLLLAVATSIDALAVGVSFACTGYTSLLQLVLPLLIIGLMSLFFSILGRHLGHRFGPTTTKRIKPELLGGIILISIGIKIILSSRVWRCILTHLYE